MKLTLYPVKNNRTDGKVYDPVNHKWVHNHPKVPVAPKKIEAKVFRWNKATYSVHVEVRTGSIATGNHKTPELAKRAFRSMCKRVDMRCDQFYYENKIYGR